MEEIKPDKPNNFQIIGINLAILTVYTIASKFIDGGFILDAFLIFLQFLICIILGIADRKGIWILAAVIILLIGYSTCVNFLAKGF